MASRFSCVHQINVRDENLSSRMTKKSVRQSKLIKITISNTFDQSIDGKSSMVLMKRVVPSNVAMAFGLQLWSVTETPR